MKTNFKYLTLFLTLSVTLTSCGVDMFNRVNGNNNVISKKRKVNNFDAIHASNGLDVYLTQGDKNSITVEADENLHEIIITEVSNNTLRIKTEENIWRAKSRKVHVTFTDVTSIKATSGSEVKSENTLQFNSIALSATSGADLELELKADHVDSSCTSGAGIELSGSTTDHITKASSGSSIDAYNLESKNVEAGVSSGADIKVFALESLTAKASSGGDVRYKGNPEKVSKKSSSGGNISGR